MPTAENLFLLVISMLTLESFRSIRFAWSHIISRLSDKSLNSFYYTLGYAAFDHLKWMTVTARLALGCIPPSLKDSAVFLSIDDTMVEKYGTKFQACSRLFDHAAHNGSNYLNGHCFVSIMLHVPLRSADGTIYLSVPLGCRLWTKELSKLELAAGMVRSVMAGLTSCRQVILLCDSWYPKKPVTGLVEGKLELLRSDSQGSGRCETLSLALGNGNRQEVILRGLYIKNNAWLKAQALKFNSSNDRYRVAIEGLEDGEDEFDYITRTGVELATGKGPDLLVGYGLIESPMSLIEKGGLADLAPLMEQSGMNKEDYFPIAFDLWSTGDSIYSVRFSGDVSERLMSAAVLGDVENPCIEDVVDALLAYQESAVYYRNFPAGSILRELLEGSETLWGMVDWEKGNCDFGGELFGKLLEAAKRYGYDGRNNYPAICSNRFIGNVYSFYSFLTQEETRERGFVPAGTFFDNGSHSISRDFNNFISINANSANIEGAWQFLQFLLREEVQGSMLEEFDEMPVKKSAFWASFEKEMLKGPSAHYGYQDGEPVTSLLDRERGEKIEAFVENACALPYKTETILEIILEEAQEYFDGVKEIPQVADAVENRVGLYLEERK